MLNFFLIFTLVTMPPKHKSNVSAGDISKKKKTITIKNKVDIVRLSKQQTIAFEEEDWHLKTP